MTRVPAEIWRLIASFSTHPDVLSLVCVSPQMRQALEQPMSSALVEARQESRCRRLRTFLDRLPPTFGQTSPSFRMRIVSREMGPWYTSHFLPGMEEWVVVDSEINPLDGHVVLLHPNELATFHSDSLLVEEGVYPRNLDLRVLQLVIFKPWVLGDARGWRSFWPRSTERSWTSTLDRDPSEQPKLVIEAAQWLHQLEEPPLFDHAVELIDQFARDLFRC